MKISSSFMLAAAMSLVIMNSSLAQSKAEKKAAEAAATKALVESKQFVFNAESASPMKARTIYLSSTTYTLTIAGDSVTADLPYYGRVYSASYGGSDGGIKFTSTDHAYSVIERKKGGWEITIETKNLQENFKLFLTVFTNGRASLNAVGNNRQSIQYSGNIGSKKK